MHERKINAQLHKARQTWVTSDKIVKNKCIKNGRIRSIEVKRCGCGLIPKLSCSKKFFFLNGLHVIKNLKIAATFVKKKRKSLLFTIVL